VVRLGQVPKVTVERFTDEVDQDARRRELLARGPAVTNTRNRRCVDFEETIEADWPTNEVCVSGALAGGP
jgi:hypothetical protein